MLSSKKITNLINSISRKNKIILLILTDFIINLFSTWISFFFLLDHTHQIDEFIISPSNNQLFVFLIFVILTIFLFLTFKIYISITRYVNINSIIQIAIPILLTSLLVGGILFYYQFYGVPRSIAFLQPIIFFILIIFYRLLIREMYIIYGSQNARSILVYGAGNAGLQAYNSISQNQNYKIKAFIDDDKNKEGLKIDNKVILSPKKVKNYIKQNNINLILVCIPSIDIFNKRKIIHFLSKLKVSIKILPGVENLIDNKINYDNFLDVGLDEILDRDLNIPNIELEDEIRNQTVLITGAGGSIGSEIAKQVLVFNPAKIILLDNSEFNLFNINNVLKLLKKNNNSKTEIISKLSSVTNNLRINNIFSKYCPNIVFHAAAYKHVPIVEENITDSIINNICGTRNVIEASIKYKSKKFLLISTDKAVRATSVMGATKRFSEMLVQAYASKMNEEGIILSMVRFGNVLNSSGSIVPLFRKQIKEGGPVTITHPEVTRYFMTIPEAVSLVLYSMHLSTGGEVFVLKMGEPIKILDLAKKMISLSGLQEKDQNLNVGDIEIKYIGLRDGEKLHEELLFDSKNINNLNQIKKNIPIMIAKENFTPLDDLLNTLEKIEELVEENNETEIIKILKNKVSDSLSID